MKKTKAISFLLSLAMMASVAIPGGLAVQTAAADGEQENKGMEISKTATANPDGTYTITLEAYATGEKIITEGTKDVPTDIVLVLDQSGSMATEDFPSVGETTYTAYTGNQTRNSNLYSKRHNNNGNNGNLYYKLDDGSYATVSVTRTQGESTYNYDPCPTNWKNYTASSRDDDYWKYSNNLYVKNEAGEHQKVTVTYKNIGGWLSSHYVYTYTFPNGKTVTSDGNDGQPGLNNFDGNGPVYYLSGTTAGEYTYTYTCTDAEGKTIDIGTSTGANTNFTEKTLYSRTVTNGGNITRLQALKNAVTGFNNSVAQKAAGKDGILGTADDIDHRIAVVGFAARKDTNPGDYQNTELFIGATQYKYGTTAQGQYGNAFQNMNTSQGQSNVTASIGALDAYGGTHIDLGMEMAKGILDNNPVPDGEKRNRVVIVFTDGSPGSGSWSNNDMTYAQNAINYANTLRNSNVNVYTVGIFNGADATSAGNRYGNDTQKANWFMQNLSDNKGKPQTPSYYLSAADSNTLNNIFKQIADNIESGGSATTLDSSAVIKDIISPQFQLPAGATSANITLETYKCTGKNGDEYTWTKNAVAMNAKATVDGDQVSVTGFDFSENWCGTETTNGTTTYRGNKLVISFNVVAKDGFLGGNGVYTNTSAGVYADKDATNPAFTFDCPQVDVEIKDVTVTAQDKNVYLLGGLTAAQLKAGATVKVGGVTLDLTKPTENWGLESWQNEYVNIAVEIKDKDGREITNLNNLTNDTTYTVSVKVSPKTTTGTATEKTGSGNGNINVFKPELTFKDSDVYYGADAPDFTENYVSAATVWKHGDDEADPDKMIGTAPTLSLTYTPEGNTVKDGKINSKEDISVDVTVKIEDTDVTSHAVFVHQNCQDQTCNVPKGKEFLLHVKTCQLTIVKTIEENGHTVDPNQTFVFKVTNNNGINMEVVIKGAGKITIKGLPVGTYTVKEDTNWSWRYTPTNPATGVITVAVSGIANDKATATFVNELTTKNWLSGNSYADNNVTTGKSSGVNVSDGSAN